MLNNINLSRVLFLDIQTVPETYSYRELNNNNKIFDENLNEVLNEENVNSGQYELNSSNMISNLNSEVMSAN